MLWLWSYPLSKKDFFLKLAVPKKPEKSLKIICDKRPFYCSCRPWGSNFIKNTLSLVFAKGFAKRVYPLHYTETYTAQKMKFFLKTADLVIFIEEILNRNLNFLCSVMSG